MTDATSPAPGWYPDPEDAVKYLRYWDGAQWTVRQLLPMQSVAPATTVELRPLGSGFHHLGAAVRLGLRAVALVAIAQVALYLWGLSMIDEAVAAGDLDTLDTYDDLDQMLSIALVIVFAVAGVSWMIWQYRLAKSAAPGELRRGPGWHAFAWITPIVAAWFPFQNIRDLWVRRFPGRSRTILGWWWTGWIATVILDRVYLASYESADTVDDFKGLVGVSLASALVTLVTLVLALRIQGTLSAAERIPALSPAAHPDA